jgi:hypothetical protein
MAISVGLEGFPVGTSAVATHFAQCTGGLGFPDAVRIVGSGVGLPVPETARPRATPAQRSRSRRTRPWRSAGQMQRLAVNPRRANRPAATARRVVTRLAPAPVSGWR